MAKLILTGKEEMMLKEILESYLSDLRMEVADTDSKKYREALKEQEAFLKDVISRLSM
ncbi:MAG: hypothetical protein OEV42_05030 [Deltaproteobacteria bacterium]|nr:hypothetical protein [Deltaproteobacteria bacterium]